MARRDRPNPSVHLQKPAPRETLVEGQKAGRVRLGARVPHQRRELDMEVRGKPEPGPWPVVVMIQAPVPGSTKKGSPHLGRKRCNSCSAGRLPRLFSFTSCVKNLPMKVRARSAKTPRLARRPPHGFLRNSCAVSPWCAMPRGQSCDKHTSTAPVTRMSRNTSRARRW